MTEPSGYTALDLIGFTDQGTYSSDSTYVENDLVHYGGNVWRCLIDDTTGVTPVEGATWTIFMEKPTTAVAEIIAPVETSSLSSRSYAAGEQLIYNDVLYTAKIAISTGDSLVVGTNIEASDTLIDQISDAVTDGIGALDVTDTVVSGSYVTGVSETDGKITVTREAADTTPTASSTKMVTSGGIKTAIDNAIEALDVTDTVVSGSYVTGVSEADGIISVTREAANTTPTSGSAKMVTSGGVYSALSGKADSATTLSGYGITDAYTTTQTDNAILSAINALDSTDSAVSGSYVTAVSEANGVTTVTREAADGTPTSGSSKMVTSGGVYTALSSKAEKSTISDAYNASTAYAVGDHFIYNDVIYTVNVACTGITPPNANYYTANNLTDLIESNSSQISNLTPFVNLSNQLASVTKTYSSSSSTTYEDIYTATQDCAIYMQITNASQADAYAKVFTVNNVTVLASSFSSTPSGVNGWFHLKKGDAVRVRGVIATYQLIAYGLY